MAWVIGMCMMCEYTLCSGRLWRIYVLYVEKVNVPIGMCTDDK